MYGTREFRFSYIDQEDGELHYIMSSNIWLANKTLVARLGEKFRDLKRAPISKPKTVPDTHCQICGREILAKTGKIAHHGYKRPGTGWQTASCFGARWRPYEVACDALPPAIESLQDYIAGTEIRLAYWVQNPPATITRTGEVYEGGRYVKKEFTHERPADFDYEAYSEQYKYRAHTHRYFSIYRAEREQLVNDIRSSKETLVYLKKRLADWRAPK